MASSTAYELQSSAKCLAAHAADEEHHGFFTATASLRGSNEVKLLRYNEDTEDLSCAAIYHHTGEVVSLGSCTTNANLLSTVYDTVPLKKGTVWKLPPLPEASNERTSSGNRVEPAPQELVAVADIPEVSGWSLHSLVWAPASEGSSGTQVLAVHDKGLRVYDIASANAAASTAPLAPVSSLDYDEPLGEASFIGCAAWDPHHASEVAVAVDGSVRMYDLRTGDSTRSLSGGMPPGGVVRSLSYNPNRPWFLATGGDDYRVKCWDVRKAVAPVKIVEGHAHWVTSVSFNPFHDQLLASGGSDGRVVLWRLSSISSAPLLELDEADALGAALPGTDGAKSGAEAGAGTGGSAKMASDVAVRVHEEHEDTITGLAWSAQSAWLYASLSYSGRVLVHAVPSGEKYRILL